MPDWFVPHFARSNGHSIGCFPFWEKYYQKKSILPGICITHNKMKEERVLRDTFIANGLADFEFHKTFYNCETGKMLLDTCMEDPYVEPGDRADYDLRPDFVFTALAHAVIVEVDEYQHRFAFSCAGRCKCPLNKPNMLCEYARMRKIAELLQKPTLFLRFNPDDYRAGTVRPIGYRRAHLIRELRACLEKGPTAFCEVKYLFYDNTVKSHQIVSK